MRCLLSVPVTIEKDGDSIPAKFVYVRNKSNRKDWLVIASTETEPSEEEIIRIYGKRWGHRSLFQGANPIFDVGSLSKTTIRISRL